MRLIEHTVVISSRHANCMASMLSTKNGSTASVDTANTMVSMNVHLSSSATKTRDNSTNLLYSDWTLRDTFAPCELFKLLLLFLFFFRPSGFFVLRSEKTGSNVGKIVSRICSWANLTILSILSSCRNFTSFVVEYKLHTSKHASAASKILSICSSLSSSMSCAESFEIN